MQPTAIARQLMELIDLHLETVALADEVDHVELRAAVVGRLGERQGELFADRWPTDPHQLAVLVNRLSSRLGYEQVVRPQLRREPGAGAGGAVMSRSTRERRKTRRQETRRQGAQKKGVPKNLLVPRLLDPASARPLLLYPEPQPIEVTARRSGWSAAICLGRRSARADRRALGPERIETLWWRGPTVRRDYYRMVTESGSQLWIFRRLADGRWFLHGIFA